VGREVSFRDRLRDIIQEAIKERRFDGVEIVKVESGYTVDSREVDITLFTRDGSPFIFIETKRKSGERGERRKFDVFAPAVIGQAVSYVFLQKRGNIHVPFFAAANPKLIAVFRTPGNIEDFVDPGRIKEREYEKVLLPGRLQELLSKYMVIGGSLELRKDFFQDVLDRLAKDYSKTRILRAELSYTLIEQFRSFVEDVSESCKELVKDRMGDDSVLKRGLERLKGEAGCIHTPESLAKMMAYVLMNKLIFYKVLERKYRIPPLTMLDSSSSKRFAENLSYYFSRAVEVTKDFEPIFNTGIYDMLPFPDESETLERINDFISFLDSIDVESIGELVGYIYEELIPPDERHRLGQFYTPPPICELIAKWAVRSPEDIVLDPGVGSGGFIIQAYKRLLKLKTGRERASDEVHKKVLDQLYSIDINPFPAHLTAMNLAMKNVRAPSTNMNIVVKDFFQIAPKQDLLAPYVVRTAAGELKRTIIIPECDAVIGNPPYTRWDEIPDPTKRAILNNLKNVIAKYKLIGGGGLRTAQNPGIYTFWIIHATRFLKEGGRLGMIISNLWLQTDYGVRFSNFLIDHYKIRAIIDFPQRIFSIPLISTLVILMEKCSDEGGRMENDVKFIYVGGEVTVDKLLRIVNEGGDGEGVYIKNIKQSNLPRDETWIQFLALKEFEEEYAGKPVIKASEIFNVSRGSVTWFMEKLAGSGADTFFYLTPSNVAKHDLDEYLGTYVYPALTSARHAKYFTFTKADWEQLRRDDRECYMFICHKPLQELPSKIKNYINWGKTECRVSEKRGGGVLCSEAAACRLRGKTRGFYGWYDLGEVVEAPIFAIYQAWYKTRFVRSYFKVAMYHALISLIPKVALPEEQIKALLAYLNSSLTQYYIETRGRRSGGGIIALEVNTAREMPILDVRRLPDDQVKALAKRFDELEAEARKIGGASEREQIEKLKPKIYGIDVEAGRILGMPEDVMRRIQESVETLIERRIRGAEEPTPEKVKGEETFKTRPRKSTGRKEGKFKTLTEFL
jgi:hypothetical protein